MPCSQNNFTLARYKQELTKLYSNVDLYVCKEADFKADGEMNLIFVQEKPLIDVPSDDDSIFNRSVFDIAHPSHAGDFHVSPSETCSSITKLQVTSNAINIST